MDAQYVTINGIEQFFLHISNDGDAVVIMLHGGPGSPNSYVSYYHQPHLNFANFVYYDQRGAGKTRMKNKTDPQTLTYDTLIEDLRQTVQYVKEKYQTDKVFIAGHSCGSLLGTRYIAEYPDDVAGYIGYGQVTNIIEQERSWCKHYKDAVLKFGNKKDIKKMEHLSNTIFTNISRAEYALLVPMISSLEYKYGYKAIDWMKIYRKSPIFSFFRDGPLMMSAEKFNQNLIGELFDFDISNIGEYQTPIYYILGKQDEWTASKIAAEYFETIKAPKKEIYWIENAGHMMDIDNPSAFFGTIKKVVSQFQNPSSKMGRAHFGR